MGGTSMKGKSGFSYLAVHVFLDSTCSTASGVNFAYTFRVAYIICLDNYYFHKGNEYV